MTRTPSHWGRWGSPGASCSGSAGPSAAAAPPWVQSSGGLHEHGGSSSPLCPQSPSSSPFPGEGLKGHRKSVSHHWGHRVFRSLSQCPRWGSVSASQPWEAPKPSALSSAQGAGPALSLLCPLVVSGTQAGWTQPGSVTLWTLSHTHLPGNSSTVGTKGTTWLPSQSC